MAGLPLEVTSQAFNILSKLEQNDYDFLNASDQLKLSFNEKKQVNGNANTEKVLKEIKSINLDETSPLEALQKLSDVCTKLYFSVFSNILMDSEDALLLLLDSLAPSLA